MTGRSIRFAALAICLLAWIGVAVALAGPSRDADACTWWPDGWPVWLGGTGQEWRHCCAAHDAAYAAGEPFLTAHWRLFACVAHVSWGMAVTMLAGLLTLGSLYIVALLNRRQPGAEKERVGGR